MMIFVRLFMTLALPFLLGYCLVAIIVGNKAILTSFERFGLAWGIGLSLSGFFMFLVSLLGISINIYTAALPIIIILMPLIAYLVSKRIKFLDLPWLKDIGQKKLKEKLFILLLGLMIFYVFLSALVKPIVNFDDLWRQGCIAKIIFMTGNIITPQTADLAGAHPYLNPISQAGIYLGIGAWNDPLGKIIFPLCFTSLLFIFYSNLCRKSSRFYALLFTYLLTSFPLIVYHAGTAYSDLMQTFYYFTGAIYLFRWMEEETSEHLVLSAIFFGIGNFVKQAGIPLWVVAAFVLFVFLFFEHKRNFRPGAIFLLLSTIVSSPWLFYRDSFLMSRLAKLFVSSAVTGQAAISPSLPYGSPTLVGILSNLAKRAFTYADWQILWFVLLLVLLLGWQHIWRSKLKYLLLIIILDLGIIVYAFLDPNTYQFLVDGTLVNRLMMYLAPVTLYFIALAARPLLCYQPKIGADTTKQRQAGKNRV
ncbi:MAG: hypothetical protein ABIA67_04785 [Candidatus Margulisiibacteriota bacterium]